jgi:aspartyl-tRNA(Asn)/glutamyl-tRNA(Gln) amidotransferase subunit B
VTKTQRQKETAADYRYFPEPDLVPVVVDDAWLARVRASIGELPHARRQRFESEYGLSAYDANVLVEQGQGVGDYFEAVVKRTGEPKLASNWVQQDALRIVNERKIAFDDFPIDAEAFAGLISRVHRRELSTQQGREVLERMLETGEAAETIITAGGYGMVTDRDALERTIAEILTANPKALEDLKNGKKKPDAVKGWLRGQVMKATGGKADPTLVVELMEAKLAEAQG